MKTAVLQVADVGPLDSLVEMLQAVGWRCLICSPRLQGELRRIGCDCVVDVASLVRGGSYEAPAFQLGEAYEEDVERCDLFVCVKAHRNYSKLVKRWPRLDGKILWYRINGGKPEHVVNDRGDFGDELCPPCPILTPNQWYSQDGIKQLFYEGLLTGDLNTYCCWPPFVRFADYDDPRLTREYHNGRFTRPLCLVHNLEGWGYGRLVEPMKKLGVAMHGERSPNGLLRHDMLRAKLKSCLAMVHLKSSDAPGYALYEALAAGCPLIVSRKLIWKCRMQELLEPGVTCLTFDRETHDGLTDEDVRTCEATIGNWLSRLSLPKFNREIGEAGRERLLKLMWSKGDELCVDSFASFMGRNFG